MERAAALCEANAAPRTPRRQLTGYNSGVGSMSELPVVAVVIVLGAYILLIQSVHSLVDNV